MSGFAMIAVALIIGFGFGAFKRVKNQVRTIGIVTAADYRYDSDSRKSTYEALVEYHAGGKVYVMKSSYRSSSFQKGKKVTVCYNKLLPEEAFIRTGSNLYLCMSLFFIFGIYVIIKTYFL
jgi:hypothetical protein